jgi:hypothetical protein
MPIMETRMLRKREKDKNLWFSMWFLASIATFGLALFPMFYQLVKRRNRHFLRQSLLEKEAITLLKNQEKQSTELVSNRNAKLWAVSIVLVLPVFIIVYLLSRDLIVHERHQQAFFSSLFHESVYVPQEIALRKYVLLTVITLGVGVIYWLYKIVNVYNSHFKQERQLEDRMVQLMEEKGYGESV